jgi:hypothetical protein
MSTVRFAGIAIVAFLFSSSGFAQSNRNQSSSNQNARSAKASPTTVVGCVMMETDYRRAHGLGKGAIGGAGLGDEYVLVDASVMPVASTSDTTNASSGAAAGSSPSTSASCAENGTGTAYRTTGARERELKPFLGQRVEVTGHFQHARDTNTSATQRGKLPPEIVVASYRAAPDEQASNASTTAAASEPAPSSPASSSVEASNETANTAPVGTSGRLPKTAGEEPLIALIGMISLGAGVGLRLLRRGLTA